MGIRNALQEMMNVLESIDVEMSEDEGHLTHIELEADIAIWDEFESTADVFPNAFPDLSSLNFEDAEPVSMTTTLKTTTWKIVISMICYRTRAGRFYTVRRPYILPI